MGNLTREFHNIMFIVSVLLIIWTIRIIALSDHEKVITKGFQDTVSLIKDLGNGAQHCTTSESQYINCPTYTVKDIAKGLQRCPIVRSTSTVCARDTMGDIQQVKSVIVSIWDSVWANFCKDVCGTQSWWSSVRWYAAGTCQACDVLKKVYLTLLSTTGLWLAVSVVGVLPLPFLINIPGVAAGLLSLVTLMSFRGSWRAEQFPDWFASIRQ